MYQVIQVIRVDMPLEPRYFYFDNLTKNYCALLLEYRKICCWCCANFVSKLLGIYIPLNYKKETLMYSIIVVTLH